MTWLEVVERGKDAMEHAGDGGRVAARGLARLGTEGDGEREGEGWNVGVAAPKTPAAAAGC